MSDKRETIKIAEIVNIVDGRFLWSGKLVSSRKDLTNPMYNKIPFPDPFPIQVKTK